MKRILLTILLCCCIASASAIGPQDSLRIVNAKWQEQLGPNRIVHREAHIEGLYEGIQSINLVEIPRSSHLRYGIAGDKGMIPTSQQAASHNAVAAINGTYYNMRQGNSTCFYKIDSQVIDSTSQGEFRGRVSGAVRVHKRKLQILEWTPTIEQNYHHKRGTVLASGPRLLHKGKTCDWSAFDPGFINSRHPRSAIYTTRKGDVVMLTVDGRSRGNADGMTIPELAFLLKVLGAQEAINLDGGGSTTLWMSGTGILNYPSDNRRFDHNGERAVSNIIYAY